MLRLSAASLTRAALAARALTHLTSAFLPATSASQPCLKPGVCALPRFHHRLSSSSPHFSIQPSLQRTPVFVKQMSTTTTAAMSWDPAASPYPSARRQDHVDTYRSATKGEVKVPDPYVWLEVPPSESEETKRFVEQQADLTATFLKKDPNRDKFRKRLTEAYDYARCTCAFPKYCPSPRHILASEADRLTQLTLSLRLLVTDCTSSPSPPVSCPSLKKDGYYYWSYNSGLQAQAVIYRTKKEDLPNTFPEQDNSAGGSLFFDPNRLSKDGTASLSSTAFSETGKYYAYGISRSGSDWFTIYVRQTDTPHAEQKDTEIPEGGQDDGRLPDVVRYAKFSGITWTHDDAGFFYQRFPNAIDHKSDTADVAGTETNSDQNAMLYYHRLGTSQDEDVLLFNNPEEPDHMFGTEITDDGRYLIMGTHKDTSPSSKTWIADLTKLDLKAATKSIEIDWTKVVDEFGASFDCIANDGTRFYFTTNKKAPRYKIVTYDLAKPEEVCHVLMRSFQLVKATYIPGSASDLIHDLLSNSRDLPISSQRIRTLSSLALLS